jgi:hypothetical protein
MFLRLFEGVEASGLGVKTDLCETLFPENFGGVLVEVRREAVQSLFRDFPKLNPLLVGTITSRKEMIVQGQRLNLPALYKAWSTSFVKALLENLEEEMAA